MDATESLVQQQQRMREIVRPYLEGAMRQPNPTPPKTRCAWLGCLGHHQAERNGRAGADRMTAPRFYGEPPPGIAGHTICPGG